MSAAKRGIRVKAVVIYQVNSPKVIDSKLAASFGSHMDGLHNDNCNLRSGTMIWGRSDMKAGVHR